MKYPELKQILEQLVVNGRMPVMICEADNLAQNQVATIIEKDPDLILDWADELEQEHSVLHYTLKMR